jgi:hypothetical protein
MPAMQARCLIWIALGTACALSASSAHAQTAPARLGGLFAPPSPGAGREPEVAEIAALLARLAQRADARDARDALSLARAALARAQAAALAGDRGRLTRAKQSAWAALGLASRRIALAAALRARIVAELRAQRAEQARKEAEQRLARAQTAAAQVEAR